MMHVLLSLVALIFTLMRSNKFLPLPSLQNSTVDNNNVLWRNEDWRTQVVITTATELSATLIDFVIGQLREGRYVLETM